MGVEGGGGVKTVEGTYIGVNHILLMGSNFYSNIQIREL